MRIAVDAMGGDHAPQNPVAGAVLTARTRGTPLVLVGRAPAVEAELAEHDTAGLDIEVVHAPEVIGMDELSPASAVRRSADNSLSRGMTIVRHGEAEGFFSAGHTGATLAAAMFRLGRVSGVRRPALAVPFPTAGGPCALLDVGANADVRPEFLLQFGIMGAAYAERVLGIAEPRVGLVSIGEERGKGNQVVQEALPLLEASDLNFIGNIEGRDIPEGNADVALTDGFTGNVLLKFAEGVGGAVQRILRDAVRGDPVSTVGGLLMRPALRRARARMDYRSYGGAVLLGVRGVVVIGHGRSDAEAVRAGVDVAARGVDQGLVEAIRAGVARTGADSGRDEADAGGRGMIEQAEG